MENPKGTAVGERGEGLVHQFANKTTAGQRGRGNVFSLVRSASPVKKEQERRILHDLPDDLAAYAMTCAAYEMTYRGTSPKRKRPPP